MVLVDFEFAISCLNKDINKIYNNFKNIFDKEGVLIHIIHQTSDENDYSNAIKALADHMNVRYTNLKKLGLPYSRNYALKNCRANYLIPTDSDVIIFPESLDSIRKFFQMNDDIDFLTLQSFYDKKAEKPRRDFSPSRFKHNKRTLLSVSSIEIIIKVNSFLSKKVMWDLNFGLGAKFGGGLETVMLQNASSAKLNGYYLPLPLCYHKEASSGSQITIERVFIRSAVFERIFGKNRGRVISLLFHIKNYKKYENLGSFNIVKKIIEDKDI